MLLIKVNNYQNLSETVAKKIIAAIQKKPDLVLGLATGSTPIGLYQELVKAFQNKKVSFAKVRTFNLDEYYGLKPNHNQSYHYFMEKHLFSKVDLKPENIEFLNGLAKNPVQECQRYEEAIKQAGGIDLQILGIGQNGHIAFNEPGSKKNSRTRLVKLTPKTIQDNSRFFENSKDVPTQALTMGIGTILEAKEIIILAGKNKKEIIGKTLTSKPTAKIPASFLKTRRKRFWIIEE